MTTHNTIAQRARQWFADLNGVQAEAMIARNLDALQVRSVCGAWGVGVGRGGVGGVGGCELRPRCVLRSELRMLLS